jgi:preprotein translocase subunit YajC
LHSLAFQAVPAAHDQGATATQSPPPGPEEGAPAPGGGSSMLLFLMFIPLLIFMFWQSRSQQKKQEATVAALKKGDRVLTQSGLIGRLLEVDSRYARIELAPGVKVQVLRSSLSGRDDDGAKSDPKSKTDSNG